MCRASATQATWFDTGAGMICVKLHTGPGHPGWLAFLTSFTYMALAMVERVVERDLLLGGNKGRLPVDGFKFQTCLFYPFFGIVVHNQSNFLNSFRWGSNHQLEF